MKPRSRNVPPMKPNRVKITYNLEVQGEKTEKELPFVIGIISDLSGNIERNLPKLKDRKFVETRKEKIDDLMRSIEPKLRIRMPNRIGHGEGGGSLELNLRFYRIGDFGPFEILQNVPALSELYRIRKYLKDFLMKLEWDQGLRILLKEFMEKILDMEVLTLPKEKELIDWFIQEGEMVWNQEIRGSCVKMLQAFIYQMLGGYMPLLEDPVIMVKLRVAKIGYSLHDQLNEILHNPEFQRLESAWRGLHLFLENTETNEMLKVRLLNLSKKELLNDLARAVEFDQSTLFKKVYEEEFGTYGGEPYSLLVGDYSFSRSPQDITLLEKIANVAAAAHAPFLGGVDSRLLDIASFGELGTPRDLSKSMTGTEMIKWNRFRQDPNSLYVGLVLPRVLLRLPYGPNSLPVHEMINFEEKVAGKDHSKYLWGTPAYALAHSIAQSFHYFRWGGWIRGIEGGGKVDFYPTPAFNTDYGYTPYKCFTEVSLSDRSEKQLSDLGFISLLHCKGTVYASFFGSQMTHSPQDYDNEKANANARISSMLPYVLVTSRFAHYFKVILRDKIGSFQSKRDISQFLNNWLTKYVLLSDEAGMEIKAKYPLREGRVDVFENPDKIGSYQVVAFLRPHFQLEELSTAIRLVSSLPTTVRK